MPNQAYALFCAPAGLQAGALTTTLGFVDLNLARDMMRQTRVWSLLQGYRDRPAADVDGVAELLQVAAQIEQRIGVILDDENAEG